MDLELELWARLDALEAEKAQLLKDVEPLEEAKARIQTSAEAARLKIKDLETRIKAKTMPRMMVICRDISLLAKALSGKPRPKAPKEH